MGCVSTAIADEVSTAVYLGMDRAVRAGHPERSIARPGDAVASAAGGAATPTLPSPTLQRHFSFATYCCSGATRSWRSKMNSRLCWPGYSPRLLAPTRPPNKCARPSTLMRTLTVSCACRGPCSPCRVTTTAAIHSPPGAPTTRRIEGRASTPGEAQPMRLPVGSLVEARRARLRVDGAVPDLAVRGDRSDEPVHARPPSCS